MSDKEKEWNDLDPFRENEDFAELDLEFEEDDEKPVWKSLKEMPTAPDYFKNTVIDLAETVGAGVVFGVGFILISPLILAAWIFIAFLTLSERFGGYK